MNRRSILAAYKKKSSHFQTGVTGFKSGNLFKMYLILYINTQTHACVCVCYSLGKYFAPAPRPLKTKRSDFTSFCNNRNDCGGVIWSNSATSERDSSAYYLVKRKGLLASSCFQHSFFYTCYIFDFLYFMTRILSHL